MLRELFNLLYVLVRLLKPAVQRCNVQVVLFRSDQHLLQYSRDNAIMRLCACTILRIIGDLPH